jgi:hypothetical protein
MKTGTKRKVSGMKSSNWPRPNKGQGSGEKTHGGYRRLNLEESIKETGISKYVIHGGDDCMWIQMWK